MYRWLLLVMLSAAAVPGMAQQTIDPAVFRALDAAQSAQQKGDHAAARKALATAAPMPDALPVIAVVGMVVPFNRSGKNSDGGLLRLPKRVKTMVMVEKLTLAKALLSEFSTKFPMAIMGRAPRNPRATRIGDIVRSIFPSPPQ